MFMRMSKKGFLVAVVLAFWLFNGLFCVCCENLFAGELTSDVISGCSDETSHPFTGSEPDDCGLCCGHQVFTAFPSEGFQIVKPAQEQVNPENILFSNQLHLFSIYHPPRF